MPFNLNYIFSYSKKKWYNKIWDTNIRYKCKRGNRNRTLNNKYINKTWSEEDINQYWEKCSFKKFFSGLLLYRFRNIIPIVAPYNCWKEFPYIYSEGARVQVLQRCISSGIIMDLRYKRKCKIRRFLSTIWL